MLSLELATIARKEKEVDDLDIECPDCNSLLTIIYDMDRTRYLCENCEQELSRRDAGGDDDNIYIVTGYNSNRGFF